MFLSENALLKTTVGSCIALCIWDRTLKIGCMAHIMLPKPTNRKVTLKTNYPAKYANLAVLNMFEELSARGCNRKDLKAYMIGGASLFPNSVNTKRVAIILSLTVVVHKLMRTTFTRIFLTGSRLLRTWKMQEYVILHIGIAKSMTVQVCPLVLIYKE